MLIFPGLSGFFITGPGCGILIGLMERRFPKIRIRKYSVADHSRVVSLQVHPEQTRYSGEIGEVLELARDHWLFHVIEVGSDIIGFFNLDTGYHRQYPFSREDEYGLRAFFIDRRFQGRGYGSAAIRALRPYLVLQFPGVSSLCLTVNCKNINAYKVYSHNGFTDSGELYHGGKAGPQHIMRMELK